MTYEPTRAIGSENNLRVELGYQAPEYGKHQHRESGWHFDSDVYFKFYLVLTLGDMPVGPNPSPDDGTAAVMVGSTERHSRSPEGPTRLRRVAPLRGIRAGIRDLHAGRGRPVDAADDGAL